MRVYRAKFVLLFLIGAFAFQFLSNSLLGAGPGMFPRHGESFLGVGSPVAWKNAVSMILLPIKIVLIGPLLPYIEFLRQEPDTPPPFFAIGFLVYWSVLALAVHALVRKLK